MITLQKNHLRKKLIKLAEKYLVRTRPEPDFTD